MKNLSLLFVLLLSCFRVFSQTEGATISMSLSSEYTVPGATYFINGNTQVAKEPVTVKLSIKAPDNKVENIDIVTDSKGYFHVEKTATTPFGKYNLTVTTADNINSQQQELWVLDADAIQEEFEKSMAELANVADEGLVEADRLASLMPPSATKEEYQKISDQLKVQLANNKKQFQETTVAFGKYISALGKVPTAYSKAVPYINQIEEQQKLAKENEKNFKDKIAKSKTNAAYCESLNYLVEAAGFISLYLDFERKIIGTMKNLLSDKAIPGAIDRHDWGKIQGQEQEDYKFKINSAQKTAFALTDKMDGLVKFISTGLSLDLIQYVGKSVYGKFCAELKGPFTGSFRADFEAGGGQGPWNYYIMNMKGNIILRYEKGGDAQKGFAVKGEFEGVYTGYTFWEDFEKVEPIPPGMMLLAREVIMAKPIDVSNISIPKVTAANGKTTLSSKSIDINNDLGLLARQMLPGTFIIKLKGKVINNKVYLTLDKEAMPNYTNIGQSNQLVIVMAQPILPIPFVKTFDFPMAPARSIFFVGMGDQQIIELIQEGEQSTGSKEINNVQTLDNGNITVRTKLSIKIGN